MSRVYVDQSHFRTPFKSPNLTLTGLGTPDEFLQSWPRGRSYFDVSRFRNPYRDGYFQDNSLFGLGEPAVEAEKEFLPEEVEALGKHGPTWLSAYLAGSGKPPSTLASNIEATSAQVPRWAFLAAAAGLGYLAYRSYKAAKAKRKAR